jgi:hypothetical protein
MVWNMIKACFGTYLRIVSWMFFHMLEAYTVYMV